MLPDRAESAKLVAAGFGALINKVLHRQCAVKENAEAFERVREWDCDVIKLKGVDRKGGQFLFGSDEHCFHLFTIELNLFCGIHFYIYIYI